MKYEIEGHVFDIRSEPLTEDVEKVLDYDNKLIWSVIDLKNIKEEDKNKDITEILTQQLMSDPERLNRYLLRQRMAEAIKTVMLCTGATPEQIKKVPLRPLFKKCKEALGGTASDFFGDLGIDMTAAMTEMNANTEK